MIITAGTDYSGTSCWMKIFAAGGFPAAINSFPPLSGEGELTESELAEHHRRLEGGIWWRTNPDPRTGLWLPPNGTEKVAVSMTPRGLQRTEYAYLGRIVATVIDWRVFEGLAKPEIFVPERKRKDETLPEIRVPMPPGFEWWMQNYGLIRDIAARRFGVHVQPFAGLLENGEEVIGKVFGWIGEGDTAKAWEAVNEDIEAHTETVDSSLKSDFAGVFDEFYSRVRRGIALDAPFIEMLNETNGKILEQVRELAPEYLRIRERIDPFVPGTQRQERPAPAEAQAT